MAQRSKISLSGTILRPAQLADLEDIIAIEERSFPTPWSRTALKAYIGDNGFLICEYQNKLVGYILTGLQVPSLFDRLERVTMGVLGNEPATETASHVMNLAVHPNYKSCGLGRCLLTTGLEYLKSLGASRVELEVRVDNTTALRLYESEGFCSIELIKGYYQNGDDAFLMSKSFNPPA